MLHQGDLEEAHYLKEAILQKHISILTNASSLEIIRPVGHGVILQVEDILYLVQRGVGSFQLSLQIYQSLIEMVLVYIQTVFRWAQKAVSVSGTIIPKLMTHYTKQLLPITNRFSLT